MQKDLTQKDSYFPLEIADMVNRRSQIIVGGSHLSARYTWLTYYCAQYILLRSWVEGRTPQIASVHNSFPSTYTSYIERDHNINNGL